MTDEDITADLSPRAAQVEAAARMHRRRTTQPLIYVAGPYRGPNAYAIETNVRDAERLGLLVYGCGGAAVIPHSQNRYFQGCVSDAFALEAALNMLRRCDAVVLTDRWRDSAGTHAEVEEAQACGLPVFESGDVAQFTSSLAAWVRAWRDERRA